MMVMRWIGALAVALGLAVETGAGELVFTNGNRLAGELTNEVLLISTGSNVLEVASEQVVLLTPDEVRLRDGRVVRGTLIGGRLKARTAYGELSVKLDDLRAFRADAPAAQATAVSTAPAPGAMGDRPKGPGQTAQGAKKIGQGVGETATGIGKTVVEGADRLHDGAKAFGEAILDAMKSVGRTIQGVFTGSAKGS